MLNKIVFVVLFLLGACNASTSAPQEDRWCTSDLNGGLAVECFVDLEDCDAFGDEHRCTHSQCYEKGGQLGGGYSGRDAQWPRAYGDVCTQVADCGQAAESQCRQETR